MNEVIIRAPSDLNISYLIEAWNCQEMCSRRIPKI